MTRRQVDLLGLDCMSLRNRRLHGLPYIRMLGQSEKIRDAEIHACRGSSRCAGA